jgi:hypothetical protein
MKKLSPYEQGTIFWTGMVRRINDHMLNDHMYKALLKEPEQRGVNSSIRSAALYEVLCFAAYCSYIQGSRIFIKLLKGFDRKEWAQFTEAIDQGLRNHIAALPDQNTNSTVSPPDAAKLSVIQYMQTFTKGNARANIPWILTIDISALQQTFDDYKENLEDSVRVLMPDGEYPAELMRWCPDATFIYKYAVECAG